MDVTIDTNITVGSSNVDLGEALTDRARAEIVNLAAKYFGKMTRAGVHFSRDGINYRCTVNVQPGGLAMMSGEAQHKDAHVALDEAVEKVAKQLRRLKRAIRDQKN